ncbi:uncharacterized protein DUF4407 [Maribacter vaceletii]|uniref:Uncharacterized protein DUF4407 n=1 Tax=Maribacter vaceletii TaxID=1206816 RepID=A0A495EBV3_9FLAO|nr:DUF4407 domain-containing protein [Maribacter vaceletii]RKR14181.1 uncharacterized protein DUF4407 [Maribacter vaceletii]
MLQKFFILCSGADSAILKTCSNGEQNKYAGIGATVFFTALMAFIASTYALYTVFDTIYTSIFFGLVWGLLIFNLDRFIVSTIKKREHFKHEFLQATPRILLAIIIAIVISKPLEIKIFEKEINQVLLEEKNQLTLANKKQILEQYTPEIEKLEQDIAQLKNEIALKENGTNALYSIYISEAEGTAGTKLLGKGPVYEEKREKHDASLAELQQLKEKNNFKIRAIEDEIAQLKSAYTTSVNTSQPIIDGFDGLMARINALNKLPWLPSFFIFLLFLAIETSPIIAKLIAPKGEYDWKLEDQENSIKTWVSQKINQRNHILETDTYLNHKIYSKIKEETKVSNHKKQKAEELLIVQANKFHSLQNNKS